MKLSKGVVALCVLLSPLLAVDGRAAPNDAAPQVPGAAVSTAAAAKAAPSSAAAPSGPSAASPPTPTGPSAAPPPSSNAPSTTPAPNNTGEAANKPKLDGATYAVRLRDLEARVDELKEQIRRSHTRLSLLSDTILSGGVGGARASIRFQNDMSGAFRLTRALFVLDGAVQYNKQDDTGALSGQKEIPIFKGSITPGDHTLQVLLRLRGHGYGVFSYLRGYQFEVKQTHSFSVTEGKEVDLDVIAWEKGGVTTPLEQRPAVRYLERLRDVTGPLPAPADTEPAPPGTGGEE
jgi:hypothetical protein